MSENKYDWLISKYKSYYWKLNIILFQMGNENQTVRTMENIPGVNLAVSLGHAINGDEEAAQRAALRGTYNLLSGGVFMAANIAGDITAETKKEELL